MRKELTNDEILDLIPAEEILGSPDTDLDPAQVDQTLRILKAHADRIRAIRDQADKWVQDLEARISWHTCRLYGFAGIQRQVSGRASFELPNGMLRTTKTEKPSRVVADRAKFREWADEQDFGSEFIKLILDETAVKKAATPQGDVLIWPVTGEIIPGLAHVEPPKGAFSLSVTVDDLKFKRPWNELRVKVEDSGGE